MKKTLFIGMALLCSFFSLDAQTVIEKRINQSSDDGFENNVQRMYLNDNSINLAYKTLIGAFRFDNLNIPNGAIINSAYIEFVCAQSNGGDASVIIKIEDNVNPPTLSDNSGNISGRSYLSSSIPWDLGTWSGGQTYTTPNIASLIQAIVAKDNWVNGNAAMIIFENTSSEIKGRKVVTFDADQTNSAKLIITYTGGSTTDDLFDHVNNDEDLDATNEYNTSANLIGTDLNISDNGGTLTVDLSSLEDSAEAAAAQATADQAVSDAANAQSSADAAQSSANAAQQTADQAVSDASLAQSSADNAQLSADAAQSAANQAQNTIDNHIVNDLDTDATNEFNNSVQLIGNELQITDGGGTLNLDLSVFENQAEVDPEVGANELNKVPVWNGSELVAGTISMVNTTVSAPEASAIGSQTVASGLGAFASGFRSTAAGINSFAIGSSTQALNSGAIAMGVQTVASGLSSLTAGFRTEASGVSSTALGVNSKARSWGEIALGINNTDYGVVGAGPGEWHPTDRLLVVGNGTNANNPSDALVILKNGNTGIGTATPEAKLDVAEDILVHGIRIGKGNDPGNYFNTAVGIDALINNTSGQYNAAFGFNAMLLNSTGTENTATGYQALMRNTEGGQNTAVGLAALAQNTTASSNTAVGYTALGEVTTGGNNTAVGSAAMVDMFEGYENVAVGAGSMIGLNNGSRNTAVGTLTGHLSQGSGNIFLGHRAGYFEAGDNKLYIDNSDTSEPLIYGDFDANQLRINGATQIVNALTVGGFLPGESAQFMEGWDIYTNSKRMSISESGVQERITIVDGGNVGFSTVNPQATVDVNGNLKLTDGTQGEGKVLISDADGFASWQTPVDEVNDADSDPFNELQDWNTLPGIPGDILDGDQVEDADANPFNESNIEANLFGTELHILDNAGVVVAELAPLKDNMGDHSATQILRMNNQPISNDGDYEGIFINNDGNVGINTEADIDYSLSVATDGVFSGAVVGTGGVQGNTRVGFNTMNNTTGFTNSAFGDSALSSTTSGFDNTGVGVAALGGNTTGSQNSAVGVLALEQNNGEGNTALGYDAGTNNSTGNANTFVGRFANASSGDLENATAIGHGATVDQSNALILGNNADVGIGTGSPAARLDVVGGDARVNGVRVGTGGSNNESNIAVGQNALDNNTSGNRNAALGTRSMMQNSTGEANTAVGYEALMLNTTGVANAASGAHALANNTTGNENTATGHFAMPFNTTGNHNTAQGNHALLNNNGTSNSSLGSYAGSNNVNGNENTLLGAFSNVAAPDLSNATAVGANALAEQSNSVILGNNADVGIGTGAPTSKLDVRGTLRLQDGTQQDGYVLTTDADGFASWQASIDKVDDADADPNNELQLLSLSGDILSISDGNQIDIPGLSQIVANANLSVQDRLDNGETPAEIYQSDNGLLQDLLGKNYQGGVIFQFDPATGNGLIARPEVVAGGPWGCFGATLLGAGNTLVGSGLQNTLDIDAGCNEPNIVAKTVLNYSHDGYNDWFLPSKDELELCLQVLRDIGFSPQFNTFIWTSSEVGSTNAWRVSIPGWRYTEPLNEYNAMNTWSFSGNNKQSGHNIIPVRSFTSDENLITQHIAEDSDLSSENELNTGLSLNNTTLELTDQGGTLSVDLASLPAAQEVDPSVQSSGVNRVAFWDGSKLTDAHIWIDLEHRSTKIGYVHDAATGIYSFTSGRSNGATGAYSTAIGIGNTASGFASMALGNGAQAVNDNELHMGGTVRANGTILSSDERFKKDVKPLQNSLGKILQLKGVTYKYKNDEFPRFNGERDEPQIGFIAQEVKEIFPELVSGDSSEENYLGIKYANMSAVLVEAIKEQQSQISERDDRISELEAKLELLSRKVDVLLNDQQTSVQGSTLNDEVPWIEQNTPNPFYNDTSIKYFIPAYAGQAQIAFYDVNGRLIQKVDLLEKGKGELNIKGGTLAPGTYIYKLIVDVKEVDMKKSVFIR